ncbi:hypothetical protein ACDQ55_17505 [Chitinophaga sp. 30R24]|uniref:hypothetical protein n=1 Tax=Chitinophaga sp. 30R24 TaxID=3248838 RepID=UPI003B91D4BB
MKYFFLLIGLPITVTAQQKVMVAPVTTTTYQRLVSGDSVVYPHTHYRSLHVTGIYSPSLTTRIKVANNHLQLKRHYPKELLISGNYSATVALRTVNRLPALQTDFVQGRSAEGSYTWQGPETNERFSYGPNRHSLSYDGQSYPYDINGRLVAGEAGNGHYANAYPNRIFRPATLFTQYLSLKGRVLNNSYQSHDFNLRLGQRNENTFIQDNSNRHTSLEASAASKFKWLRVTGKYDIFQDRFSNANRNGFLNQVYEQAMLTPVSFDNSQGYMLGAGQRSYSLGADNPFFLLKGNGNYYHASRQQGSLVLERNQYRSPQIKLTQSLSNYTENSSEGYKPGGAWFPEGIQWLRNKRDGQYSLKAEASKVWENTDILSSPMVTANYELIDDHSAIYYRSIGNEYRYQRSSQEINIGYQASYKGVNRLLVALNAKNKAYISNTATHNDYWLPLLGLYASYDFPASYWTVHVRSTLADFNTELPVNKSLAAVNLLRYHVATAGSYMPATEVAGFDQVAPVQHREWNVNLGVGNNRVLRFNTTYFVKHVNQDVFPVLEGGSYVLRNMANHRIQGWELELELFNNHYRRHQWYVTSVINFLSYKSKVTHVNDGFDYTPIAGFSDVHTTLVAGRPLGVIEGSTWLRDGDGKLLIGADGFPQQAPLPAVIGNPTPDFIMKSSHTLSWKKWSLNMDLEWKKGGDRWNGTQAVLDYYGRSDNSGRQRNISGYVFPGVTADGSANQQAVDFYNPKLPLTANRWVRYGLTGVAASYVQKADWCRIHTLQLSFKQPVKSIIRAFTLSAYINNLMLWSPYKGVDPEQLLFDQGNTEGLDFFNLPSTKTFGFNVSFQF